MVTAVFAKEDVVLFIQQNKFYGGRADVDTGAVEFHGEIVSLSKGNNGFGNSAHLNRNPVKWALQMLNNTIVKRLVMCLYFTGA